MSRPRPPRGLALLLAWALLVITGLVSGCAADPASAGPLVADPGVIHLDPDRTQVEVTIHNLSDMPRPLAPLELGGEDWGSLRFIDDSLPRAIPAHDAVRVQLEVSAASFREQPGVYRSGRASLTVRSDRYELVVPLEFVGTAARGPAAPPAWLSLALFLTVGLAALLIPPARASPARSPARAALLTRLASPSVTTTGERLLFGSAIAAALLVAASIPFGAGVCEGRAGARVGAAELEACRAGLGGYPLTLLPASPGLWWWVIALALLAAATAALRARTGGSPAISAAAMVRVLGFAIAVAGLLVGLAPGSAAPVDLVRAQLRGVDLGGVGLPAWGLIAQPLACLASVALIAGPNDSGERSSDPAHLALARLERWLWSAVLVTVFLGGWAVPGLSGRPIPPLSHAGMLAVELLAFTVKLALVDLGLRRLAAWVDARLPGRASPGAWLQVQLRWAIPLLLVNLLAVTLWRAL